MSKSLDEDANLLSTSPTPPADNYVVPYCKYMKKAAETSALERELSQAKSRIVELEDELRTVKNQYQSVETQLAEMLLAKSTPNEEVCKMLSPLFSPEQIKSLLSGHTHINKYSEEAIVNGITLHSLSSKAFNYIRDVLKMPLPSVSTLRKHISGIKCEPGIQNSVLRVLKSKIKSIEPFNRVCSLSFDEMSIEKKYS